MRYLKYFIALSVICLVFGGTSAYAFELLYETRGKAYYKTDEGKTIEHTIDQYAKSPSFLYRTADNQVMYFRAPDGKILECRSLGAALSSVPEYDWRNGCSPTSTGMMMGYYDLNGYGGLYYQKLIPRGPAETSTFVLSSQRANKSISSSDHIADYYTGYTNSGDDPCNGNLTTCHGGGNCLADFMGTSQDMDWLTITSGCSSSGLTKPVNSDGGTRFWNYSGGTVLTWATMDSWDNCFWETSGMYGIGEYVQYRGYSHSSLYNQKIDAAVASGGFTYANFKTEIDNGRPVLIHVIGHTMLGYGYLDPNTIYLRDTWSAGLHTMTWGGTYGSSPPMAHDAVTCFTPSGGSATPDDIVASLAPAILMLLNQ